jgi:hypothetical protein
LPAPPPPPTPVYERPAFLDALRDAYADRGKGVVVLTGNTNDRFWCREKEKFLTLEQTVYWAYQEAFTVLRVDASEGISSWLESDLTELAKLCSRHDNAVGKESPKRIGDLERNIALNRGTSLATVQLLAQLLDVVYKAREQQKEKGKVEAKRVCTIVQFSGSIFPSGDFDRLSELDRQRLVTFLNLASAPWFENSNHLIILVADTKSQINTRITSLPSVDCVEIGMPEAAEREKFIKSFNTVSGTAQPVDFEMPFDRFIAETAGLPLTALQELLKAASRTGKKISRKAVINQLASVVKSQLEGVAKLKYIEHSAGDVVGYKKTGEIWRHTFKRCENKATAVPVVIVSGPNGGGKTFQAEAYAKESGRLVLELTGLRSKWFGETDSVFEKLQLLLRSLGNILIIVDEAHTKFGSVHKSDTHETERRLAGNLIALQGDPSMFGKVIWLLATSRPDELDPDILSRSPVQIPIFDLEGDDRKEFVKALFARKNIIIPDDEFDQVIAKTASYSNRDFGFLVAEVLSRSISVLETLGIWQATTAIRAKRKAQSVIAAQTCSYPDLLPSFLRDKVGTKEFDLDLQAARLVLAG